MARILHIARTPTVSAERQVAAMARDGRVSLSLVREATAVSPEVDAIRADAGFERVLRVRIQRWHDPHRRLYLTAGFGLRAARPDIIHVEEEPEGLAALQVAAARRCLRPNARLVLFTWQNLNREKSPMVRWVLRRNLHAADAIICGSGGAAALLRELGYRRPTPVIPALALDPSTYYRRPVERHSEAFTVGFVGRLLPEKGLDILIQAVAALGPPVALAVAGSGPARPQFEEHARSAGLGNAVRFVGALDPDGVARFLSGIDVLAVPSRTTAFWQEQYGRVIVEAMGCALPVVGSDTGAIPEVMGPAGLLFPEGDVAALTAHLARLRGSAALRAELGGRGRDWALATQTLELRAQQVLAFYRELLAQPTGAAR